ncbi:unnamed protein product [Cuscuta epithymum]|uniref:BHLH domain-containing protein n=1 Tax=Cuscuta epithymum TaxID=186058 RepID=A0AAV0E500_9ASTE|nr:unnamed protein product [Cuscuta epithymum]
MKTVKDHHGEEEEDELGSKKNATNSHSSTPGDGKNNDKANVIRSKHSVTEQRRRSKINERFQILRDLIPNTDQKRDTASFLFEVIQYVQYLQEKVQKYEGSYQAWSSEPTKLMPWRNSHWRLQSFSESPPQAVKNGPAYAGRFDENAITAPSTALQPTIQQNRVESSSATFNGVQHNELATKHLLASLPASDAQSTECLPNRMEDALGQQAEPPAIEGGTINFSGVYSQGLLNSLGQALQSTGVDLSHATISVQIDLGKRANRGLSTAVMGARDIDHKKPAAPSSSQVVGYFREPDTDGDMDQAQKRLRI